MITEVLEREQIGFIELTSDDVREMLHTVMSDKQKEEYDENLEIDFRKRILNPASTIGAGFFVPYLCTSFFGADLDLTAIAVEI